ncbi:MAG: ADP-glyceromanno-heptose 6-epimerase, partial [Bacteroidota bacterium]
GAAGFIASGLVQQLNEEGYYDLVLVDDFSREDRRANYENKRYSKLVERSEFVEWLHDNENQVQFVFHLGARTDTTEFDYAIFEKLNVQFSKDVWNACVEHGIPLVYASSAATYGDGELGYEDNHEIIGQLKPLNPYGESKNEFDKWALNQEKKPYFWAGLKFFNVYGPNEYHKGRMASVISHAFKQIIDTGKVKLFRSHKEEYEDGGQMRDFVYVKDVATVCTFLMHHRKGSGLYNLGSGKARTFKALAEATFQAMDVDPIIEFIDTPADIRDKYQYFTEANMQKLKDQGYPKAFHSLEEGVADYVKNYLIPNRYW